MRTTLTIDADVAKRIEQERRRSQRSLKEIINDALRVGLSIGAAAPSATRPFRVDAKRLGFRPGVDPERLNQLLDSLDAEHFSRKAAEDRAKYGEPEE